jgi:hypothetical protein
MDVVRKSISLRVDLAFLKLRNTFQLGTAGSSAFTCRSCSRDIPSVSSRPAFAPFFKSSSNCLISSYRKDQWQPYRKHCKTCTSPSCSLSHCSP